MPGYWNKPEATASTIIDGWLHTGDVGHVDDEGYLFITDRAKDMLIRGGENIYCVEIENRLVEHPGVADAAVIGVPARDPRRRGQGRDRGRSRRATRPTTRSASGSPGRLAPFKVPDLHRALGRQAAAERVGQAAQERAARRGPRELRRDDVGARRRVLTRQELVHIGLRSSKHRRNRRSIRCGIPS